MANQNAPYGLAVFNRQASDIVLNAICLAADAAVLGVGDPVKIATLGDRGQLTVTRATAGGGIDGVVVNTQNPFSRTQGFTYAMTDRRRAASVLNSVEIILTSPGYNKVFSIQAAGTSLTATQANKFFDLSTVGNASAQLYLSTVTLASATAHASQGDLFLLGLDTYYPYTNVITDDYAKVLVTIANT